MPLPYTEAWLCIHRTMNPAANAATMNATTDNQIMSGRWYPHSVPVPVRKRYPRSPIPAGWGCWHAARMPCEENLARRHHEGPSLNQAVPPTTPRGPWRGSCGQNPGPLPKQATEKTHHLFHVLLRFGIRRGEPTILDHGTFPCVARRQRQFLVAIEHAQQIGQVGGANLRILFGFHRGMLSVCRRARCNPITLSRCRNDLHQPQPTFARTGFLIEVRC